MHKTTGKFSENSREGQNLLSIGIQAPVVKRSAGTDARMYRRFRLIVNADDFGYCPARNRGILECIQAGAISSVSLLVNGIAVKDAIGIAKGKGIALGLHLNLTEGHPCSNGSTSLASSNGFMLGKIGFRRALRQGLVRYEHIADEIGAQIIRFRELCGHLPTHVDGHQHVHVLPGVREIFAESLKKYRIERTRLPMESNIAQCNWVQPKERLEFYEEIVKDCRAAKEIFNKADIRYPHCFVGMTTMGSDMNISRLQERLISTIENYHRDNDKNESTSAKTQDAGPETVITCELMVHPGYPSSPGVGGCGQGPDDFSCSPDRRHEMDILASSDMFHFYKSFNIKMASFQDI